MWKLLKEEEKTEIEELAEKEEMPIAEPIRRTEEELRPGGKIGESEIEDQPELAEAGAEVMETPPEIADV